MRTGWVLAALVLGALLLACDGDDPTGPENFGNDGGVGNATLLVQATVDVNQVTGGFVTEVRVDVSGRDGEPVSDADVVLHGGFGDRAVPQVEEGSYRLDLDAAAWGTLRLDVAKDDMFVRDVVLGNIGVHDFITPKANDTLTAERPLEIRWFRDQEAPFVRISTFDFARGRLFDRGEFVIPDSLNPARENQRVEIFRSNEVQIAGGLRGSFFRMEVTNSVQPVTVLPEDDQG